MITWMQRHKKYLIVTIWISTIAFVGAGFVGWGQYSYGDKAGAVAKVGNVEVSMGEFQQSYSNLYNQYNQIFKGDFDEEKAKSFGLQKQALNHLVQQALILNLAESYNLQISDKELLAKLEKEKYFFNNGKFDKEVYKKVLSRNNLNMKEYESNLKKQLLVDKTLNLLPVAQNKEEVDILSTILNIADKINYKVLDDKNIPVDTSDAALKPYWEKSKNSFMTEVTYDIEFIKQEKASNKYDDAKIAKHYNENKNHFKAKDGKILSLEDAKEKVVQKLNAKATKDLALRSYIAYKKDKLDSKVQIQTITISDSKNPFTKEVLTKISKLTTKSPYMKPVLVEDDYYTFKLVKTNPSQPKSYEAAKQELLPLFVAQEKEKKLLELAKNSMATFNGKTTDYITSQDALKLTDLSEMEAREFLAILFSQQTKRDFIRLGNGKIVLYNILEQKLLNKDNNEHGDVIAKLKQEMFSRGLINNLQNKYKTEIFIQGI